MFAYRSVVATAVCCIGVFVGACQSAKVAEVRQQGSLTSVESATVERFDVSGVEWVGDHGDHTPQEVERELHGELIKQLNARGIPASDGGRASVVTRGKIVLVDAGSGTKRALWGFGSGQSKLVCEVQVVDGASGQVAYELTIHGGSHGRGGLLSSGYLTLADARDAAEQIAEFLEKQKRE